VPVFHAFFKYTQRESFDEGFSEQKVDPTPQKNLLFPWKQSLSIKIHVNFSSKEKKWF